MSARRHSRSTTPPPAPTLPSAPNAPPAPRVPPAGALHPEPVAGVEADGRVVGRPGGQADLVGAGRPGPVDHRLQQGPADAGAPVAVDDEHAEVGDPAAQAGVDGADDLPAGV